MIRSSRKTVLGLLPAFAAEVVLIIVASIFRDHEDLWMFPLAVAGSAAAVPWIVYGRLSARSRVVRGIIAAGAGVAVSALGAWSALIVLISVCGE